jgi:hypothetical protein
MQDRNKYTEIEHFIANESSAQRFALTRLRLLGRMDIEKRYRAKLLKEHEHGFVQ